MRKTIQFMSNGTGAEVAYSANLDGERVKSIVVSNQSGGPVNIKVFVDPNGKNSDDINCIVPQKSIADDSYEELIPNSEFYLSKSGTVSVLDATGGAVAFTITVER